jgi:hypothetical protein
MMGAVRISETWVNFYETAEHNITEDSHFLVTSVRTWNLNIFGISIISLHSEVPVESAYICVLYVSSDYLFRNIFWEEEGGQRYVEKKE